eukprot:gnl/MRDRNA2_/MRDRNA2_153752_c0_seq1.p1 gnl/MRDRNA2_/MRDRNA2_153752_c0~~gnl/MRDRNA2_/MRDRNA2_153752_c0_seq1.p1  ORF type:complete len:335 (+),score=76.72 gnl/MRDRNA2_/MRDRNA2_153752_c0_seq1:133-1005(+)
MEQAVPDKVTTPKGATEEQDTPIALKKEASNNDQPSSPAKIPKGLAHMKDAVQKHMNNLKEFRTFLKKHFKSPAEAFDIIAADAADGILQQDVFVKKVKELGFSGNADALFGVINENGKGVSKDQFKQILTAQRKGNAFLDLVEQAVQNKEEIKGKEEKEQKRASKEASGQRTSFSEKEKEDIDKDRPKSSSPRESRGRSKVRDSSPKASKRDSSPKPSGKDRASSPKGERVPRRKSEGDLPADAAFGRTNSVSGQPGRDALRGNSKGSLASMSTAASTPTNHQVKKKGL